MIADGREACIRVATWNCNSIRARLEYLVEWLGRDQPDVVCLQETKIEDAVFPHAALQSIGYSAVIHGQKTYNGVAILSREGLSVSQIEHGIGDPDLDHQARVIAATIEGMRIVSVYVPNGKSTTHPDFQLKVRFLNRLREYLDEHHDPADPIALCGDYNVAPDDRDVHDPEAWGDSLLCHPDERAALERLLGWGLEDAYRKHHAEAGLYSWWDYRGAAFRFDHGMRIDLILLSGPLADRCTAAEILRQERKVKGKERLKPSDHAPVVVTIAS